MVAALGRRTVLDGKPAVTFPLRFADGTVFLGPFKVAQLAPWHRSTMYPVTPTLSVDAVQLRLIWLPLAVAVRFVGAVGGCVSGIVPPVTFE